MSKPTPERHGHALRTTGSLQVVEAGTKSATETVLEYIRSGIASGMLAPGQRLRERELIEACSVGRSVVREALRTLAADGTIAMEHGRSAVVRRFSRDEVRNQHQVREVIEGLAAGLAAAHVDKHGRPSELVDLEKLLDATIAQRDQAAYLQLNYELHALIVRMSENPVIQEHLDRAMTTQFRLQAARFMTYEGMMRSHTEHKAIIDAILNGDPAGAEAAMRRHIRGTRRTFLEMPDDMFGGASS